MALECFANVGVLSRLATTAPLAAPSSATASEQARLSLPKCSGLRFFISSRGSAGSRNLQKHARVSRIFCQQQQQQQQEILAPAGAVSDKTWKDLVIESDLPVLVDFWAPWCGPCRMIAPLVDDLARQYAGRIKCYKLNTDESPSKATEYGIRSIPTVIIFKGGAKKDAIVGAVPKATLMAAIEKYLDR